MSQPQDNAAATAPPSNAPGAASHGKKAPPQKSKGGVVVERPGAEPGSWERWLLLPGATPRPLGENALPRGERILLLPSARVFAWPLWIAGRGEATELARLELSGRHLLKRGMEESLSVLPILERDDRRLVLAVAPEEEFPSSGLPQDWARATRFDLVPRTQEATAETDLILWREWGASFLAFRRNGKPLWFSEMRGDSPGAIAQRTALRLLAEGVLDRLPSAVQISGLPDGDSAPAVEELKKAFPKARISVLSREAGSPAPPPVLFPDPCDLPPAAARRERDRGQRRSRMVSFVLSGGILYLLLILLGTGTLLARHLELRKLRHEISLKQAPSLEGKTDSERWKELRPAVDPSVFALDLLAAAASATEGGKVRLTRFSLERGRLQISGEATDVTQAYAFIEQIKKNPTLREYDWSAGQPQLAGKNSVRLDMEGTRPDAPPGRQ